MWTTIFLLVHLMIIKKALYNQQWEKTSQELKIGAYWLKEVSVQAWVSKESCHCRGQKNCTWKDNYQIALFPALNKSPYCTRKAPHQGCIKYWIIRFLSPGTPEWGTNVWTDARMMQRNNFPCQAMEYEGHPTKDLDSWLLWRGIAKSTRDIK